MLKLSICTLINSDGSGLKAERRETLFGHRLSALKLQVLKSYKYLLLKDIYIHKVLSVQVKVLYLVFLKI